ncbi:sigma-54-dependent Fis family transcriptional regulator [Bacillus canaveralius]|uniref:Sigma-54-dependent Fis family transcriptional regulator n=1 Tax=Bacillus canaveralius TaxID=1403243 RepID=A0A2N5GSP4_9BACI|nr:sigma 54-interacting transcriptional regulator [Bacillus canaveralius]PLR86791.1 sigma-54-dependent Fis family transcriptional regulator [Bacillus canaveralius]PLR92748.1 sigma-54-dependent Fis family transcriptional regulator [Bacillus canaveralius]
MKQKDSFALHTLHTLLSSLEEAISIINMEGEMIFWNEAAENTYQIKKEKIIGKNIQEFFEQEDIMNLKVLQSQHSVRDMYHIPRPDKHVLISASPIYNENNELIGSMSVEKDITSTIKLNEKLTTTSTELQQLKQRINNNHTEDPFNKLIGKNTDIQRIILDAKKVAKTDATILINGESGVGKELFAQAIQEESLRNNKPFIAINCGAIPPALFESELFGYEAGAYTGASKGGRPGKLELASGGTLFLDEVGELPLDMQVKLLRALQEKEIYRIGGQAPKKVDVRIIAATNRTLENMIEEGKFRSDLFYRLNVFSIDIPPLRERIDDIPYLIDHFFKDLTLKYSKPIPAVHKEALNRLSCYHWPGNIRELRNLVERIVILNESNEITEKDISLLLPKTKDYSTPSGKIVLTLSLEKERLEKERILQTLQKTYGNKSITASELGMSRATLYKKMRKYGIE